MYNGKLNIIFYGNKIPKGNERHACLFVISLDSIVDVDKQNYPQIFLEKYNYAVKKKKIINAINDELNLDESDECGAFNED